MGTQTDKNIQQQIVNENEKYGDIIQAGKIEAKHEAKHEAEKIDSFKVTYRKSQ